MGMNLGVRHTSSQPMVILQRGSRLKAPSFAWQRKRRTHIYSYIIYIERDSYSYPIRKFGGKN